jgi:hypothetical protein
LGEKFMTQRLFITFYQVFVFFFEKNTSFIEQKLNDKFIFFFSITIRLYEKIFFDQILYEHIEKKFQNENY